jgi:hypothetical protein
MLGFRHSGCKVPNEREKKLIGEVEATQARLRETIEASKRLAERSDALIAKVKHGLESNDNATAEEPVPSQL